MEEALDNLEYSDLVKKTGIKYQTAFFISEPGDGTPLQNLIIERCETSAVLIYDTMYEVMLKETGCDKYIPLPSSIYLIE